MFMSVYIYQYTYKHAHTHACMWDSPYMMLVKGLKA